MSRLVLVDIERKPAVLVTHDINGMPINLQTYEALCCRVSSYLLELMNLNQVVYLTQEWFDVINLIQNLTLKLRAPKTGEQILILRGLCTSEVRILDSIAFSELYEDWKQFASYPEVPDYHEDDLDEEGIVK